jgi:hypothetical protein
MALARLQMGHVLQQPADVPVFPTPDEALHGLFVNYLTLHRQDQNQTRFPYVGRSKAEDGTAWCWVAVDAEAAHETFVAMQADIADALACGPQCSLVAVPVIDVMRCIKVHLDDAVKDPQTDFFQLLSIGGTGDGKGQEAGVSRWFAMFQVGSLQFFPELIGRAAAACEKILARPGRPRDEVDEKMLVALRRQATRDPTGTVSARALVQVSGKDPSVVRKRLNRLEEVERVRKGRYRLRQKEE